MKGKFKDIAKDFGYLKEQNIDSKNPDRDPWQDLYDKDPDFKYSGNQNTTAGEFEVNVPVQNEMEKVKIKYGHATGPLDDVTISWGDESHNVDFEEGDQIEDHDNEGKDIEFIAYSQDNKWRFIVTVSVEANYELSGNIQDVNWDTLEIDLDESKANDEMETRYDYDDPVFENLKENLKKRAGIIK